MLQFQGTFPIKLVTTQMEGHALLEAAGYIQTVSPGCIALLPLGSAVIQNISRKLRELCGTSEFAEIGIPLLQKSSLWDESGRREKYPGLLCETSIGGKSFVINPTQEESILDLFRRAGLRSRDLPLRVFQISERIRNEIRPAHGLIRSRCFTLADLYSICPDEGMMEIEALRLEEIIEKIIAWTGLTTNRALYYPSTMGVPVYSYWTPSQTKQCLIPVCTACGLSYRVREALNRCPACGHTELNIVSAVEIGDVMRSGKVLAEAMCVTPRDSASFVHVTMAGIGVSRLLQLVAEKYSDKNGLKWPRHISPFEIHVIGSLERTKEAQQLSEILETAGYSVMLDLRSLPLKRRIEEAEVIGLPLHIILGSETVPGTLNVYERETRKNYPMSVRELQNYLSSKWNFKTN